MIDRRVRHRDRSDSPMTARPVVAPASPSATQVRVLAKVIRASEPSPRAGAAREAALEMPARAGRKSGPALSQVAGGDYTAMRSLRAALLPRSGRRQVRPRGTRNAGYPGIPASPGD